MPCDRTPFAPLLTREREKKNGGEEGESDDDMLYGTRTAGARQASSHPEIAENAGNRDNTLYIHLVSRSLCCQVGPPDGATVMSNPLVYSLSVRLSFTCQPLIFAWVETSQPTTYCKCVVYSTSPKTTPFGARPATRNTKKRENATRDSGSVPVTATAQVTVSALLLLSSEKTSR